MRIHLTQIAQPNRVPPSARLKAVLSERYPSAYNRLHTHVETYYTYITIYTYVSLKAKWLRWFLYLFVEHKDRLSFHICHFFENYITLFGPDLCPPFCYLWWDDVRVHVSKTKTEPRSVIEQIYIITCLKRNSVEAQRLHGSCVVFSCVVDCAHKH